LRLFPSLSLSLLGVKMSTAKLVCVCVCVARSQSKLTQEQLSELQKATLFERKELQQWYKGTFCSRRFGF
jgi:hypothetical protein